MIMAWHRSNPASNRLNGIPGVGPLLSTALVASVADPKTFRSGRNFSAWIGKHSSGGRDKLGSISKQGDRYLRGLCQDPWHQASTLAHSIAGTATHQSRRDRACQQAGPDGVGDDGYWRALQSSGLAEGLTRSRRHPA